MVALASDEQTLVLQRHVAQSNHRVAHRALREHRVSRRLLREHPATVGQTKTVQPTSFPQKLIHRFQPLSAFGDMSAYRSSPNFRPPILPVAHLTV